MAYYKTCPVCGANLDPGEKCECSEEIRAVKPETDIKDLMVEEANGQLRLELGGDYECMRDVRSVA